MSNHVIITGTGRAGTTFLMQLLTVLGFDTGFTEKDFKTLIHPVSLGGLEYDIRRYGRKPYIIKNPWICDYIDEVLSRDDIVIDHAFIPIRNLHDAAESRRRISKQGIIEGGMWACDSQEKGIQENILVKKFYHLILRLSEKNVPITFIHFPKLITDSDYLYQALFPLFKLIRNLYDIEDPFWETKLFARFDHEHFKLIDEHCKLIDEDLIDHEKVS